MIWIMLLFFCACIRDKVPVCPPLTVYLEVDEKNYGNIDELGGVIPARPEDMAFREYVPSLHCELVDANTGQVVEKLALSDVPTDEAAFPISFCSCLPHGRYAITVWGGLEDSMAIAGHAHYMELHRDSKPGPDAYLLHDTLVYDACSYDYHCGMKRVMSGLMVIMENLPDSVYVLDKSISGLYGRVDRHFNYSGSASVSTHRTWDTVRIQEWDAVSPSVADSSTEIGIRLRAVGADAPKIADPPDVEVTLKRNELTVLRYNYDAEEDRYEVFLLSDGEWASIHQMDLD